MSEFEKIAKECVRKAEQVRCPLSQFVEGLRTICDELNERLELAEAEQDSKEETC